MKTLLSVVGGIVLFIVLLISISFVQKSIVQKNAETELRKKESTVKTITSADDKIQKAQELLSKKSSSEKDQKEARQLINDSINESKKATEMQPENPQTWYYLSETYYKLSGINPKVVDLAIDALNHSVALAPNNDNFLNRRARAYIFQKKFPEAEKDLVKAIQINPKKADHFFKLGNVYKEMGKKDLAKANYLQAIKLTSPENKMALATIDVMMKELDEKEILSPTPH